jgi:hypothetical protein
VKTQERFPSVLLDGHKGLAFEIPFSPATRWGLPQVRLRPGRRGYRVRGTLNRTPFEGFAVARSGRFWVLVPDALQKSAGVEAGETVKVSLEPAVDG